MNINDHVNDIAQAIRTADGNHDLGAGALADALLASPALARLLAAARDEARTEIAASVAAGRDGYLGSERLNPAWVAGWHAATDHHAARITRGGTR